MQFITIVVINGLLQLPSGLRFGESSAHCLSHCQRSLVRIDLEACEKIASDLGLGDGCKLVTQISPTVDDWPVTIYLSNAGATFVQRARMQRFLKTIFTLSCWYSLESFAEYSEMSTHVPGFHSFFRFFA